ncbi:DUF664 domain-containing protein [Microlunatus speluncae]|uniref:mycothiol transferase n=1 Tax=Microlunatus speluncae TaxID=2594267 RepID=UPI001C2DC060
MTYVEGVWFDQTFTGRTYREIGIASTRDRSFTLRATDTIDSVREAHRLRCEASRAALAELRLSDRVDGRGVVMRRMSAASQQRHLAFGQIGPSRRTL